MIVRAVMLAVVAGFGLAAPADAAVTSAPLLSAQPRVHRLAPRPSSATIRLEAGAADWRGRLAHLGGTAHYDGGEWIYEDFPFTAFGAAPGGVVQAQEGLEALGQAAPETQRLPGGMAEFVSTSGAGPFVDEADLSELRLAVRGSNLHLLARTTTMKTPVRTALLLLFDTVPGSANRSVPFGSGLTTARGDVAVLVTAAGARVVDLVTGGESTSPAAARPDGYENALGAVLPIGAVSAPGEGSVALVGAVGLVAPGSSTLEAGGDAGPLAKVVPRFDEPVQNVYERRQAIALGHHDIDRFFTTVSLERLRRGDRERLRPGIGYSVRTMLAPAERSKEEGGTDGVLREYGLYLPRGYAGRPAPATMLLRGSGMTAHSLPAITPASVSQLGDDSHAIVVSPGGRSGFDLFTGAAYLDAEQALADARRTVSIDRDRISVAGYSMGGYATYMFAATRPDRYAGAFVIEGPVGGAQPATKTPIVNAFADVVPALVNLTHTPIAINQTAHDANVPVSNALAASTRLRDAGLRYRLDVMPGDHFSPGIFNDYGIGAAYLSGLRRATNPATVRLTRSLPFERAIDTGSDSDAPLAGTAVGLRFGDAWFVHDLEPADHTNGIASIDVRTLARRPDVGTPVRVQGTTPGGGAGGAPPSVYDEQRWKAPTSDGPLRNAFRVRLSGARSVTLDLTGMNLTLSRRLTGTITTDAPTVVTLRGRGTRRVRFALPPGEHRVRAPARRPARRQASGT